MIDPAKTFRCPLLRRNNFFNTHGFQFKRRRPSKSVMILIGKEKGRWNSFQ